jgi:hypothetical protein
MPSMVCFVNGALRDLMMVQETRNGCVVDDDKLHLDTNRTDDENANLKKAKHVSDNGWGFVIDTLSSYSVSGLPARFSAHKKGDTPESQLISLVLSQISPAAGANQRDALQGLSIAVCAELRIDKSA